MFNYQQQAGKQSVTANSASEKCDQIQIPVPPSFRNKNTICKTFKAPLLYKIQSRRASMPIFTITDSEEENNDGDKSDYGEKEDDEDGHVREKKLKIVSARSRKKNNPKMKPYQLTVQRKRKTEAAKKPKEATNTMNIQHETSATNANLSINDIYFVDENTDGCGMCKHFFLL